MQVNDEFANYLQEYNRISENTTERHYRWCSVKHVKEVLLKGMSRNRQLITMAVVISSSISLRKARKQCGIYDMGMTDGSPYQLSQ